MRRGNFNGNINQIKYEDDDGKKKSAACAQKKISFSLCFVAIVKYFFCWPLQLWLALLMVRNKKQTC